eukprot:934876-Rhodomonas_salina.1
MNQRAGHLVSAVYAGCRVVYHLVGAAAAYPLVGVKESGGWVESRERLRESRGDRERAEVGSRVERASGGDRARALGRGSRERERGVEA